MVRAEHKSNERMTGHVLPMARYSAMEAMLFTSAIRAGSSIWVRWRLALSATAVRSRSHDTVSEAIFSMVRFNVHEVAGLKFAHEKVPGRFWIYGARLSMSNDNGFCMIQREIFQY